MFREPLGCVRLVEISLSLSLLLLLYLKLLSCKNASGGSDINNTYRMENLVALREKVTVLLFSDERRQIEFARALHRDSVPLNDCCCP